MSLSDDHYDQYMMAANPSHSKLLRRNRPSLTRQPDAVHDICQVISAIPYFHQWMHISSFESIGYSNGCINDSYSMLHMNVDMLHFVNKILPVKNISNNFKYYSVNERK